MRDIHRLAWELRPAALDDFGLEMALRRYADEWAALSGVPVDFHSRRHDRTAPGAGTRNHPLPRRAARRSRTSSATPKPSASVFCSSAGPTTSR